MLWQNEHLHYRKRPHILSGSDDIADGGQKQGLAASLCHREDRLHCVARLINEPAQLLAIGFHVRDRTLGDAAVGRGLGYRRRDNLDEARVKRLWNEVFAAEAKLLPLIR